MPTSSSWSTLVLIALMVVAFYFLAIRPQKKRQQAQQRTLNTLQPGTRVLLSSGLFGTILAIGDKQAVLELSPGVELTVLKQAIARVVADDEEDTAWTDSDDDEVDAADELVDPEPVMNSDPRDLGSRDLGSHDVEHRNLGSADLGSRDLASRDLGSQDQGHVTRERTEVGRTDGTAGTQAMRLGSTESSTLPAVDPEPHSGTRSAQTKD